MAANSNPSSLSSDYQNGGMNSSLQLIRNTSSLLFLHMESRGLQGNSVTFIGLLKACASLAEKENGKVLEDLELVVNFSSLDRGMALHSLATARGIDTNALVASSLVEMYARCGSVVDAWKVFLGAPKRDVVLWTSLMQGSFLENGQSEVVLELFVETQRERSGANARTFVAVFQAITSLAKRERGEETIHGRTVSGKSMGDALGVFSTIFQPNQVCWMALMLGYVKNSQAETALHFSLLMQLEGCSPDVWTLVCELKACGSSVALRLGRILHEEITSLGFQFQGAVISSLVDFYSRCGSMDEAELVFNSVSRKDAVSWSSLIAGYSR
ncbi:pentatricopeptide repeat-containing protein At2g34400-like [Selaginella moellendorffii]|uniref:pentatricopeptide repeat-containing protein At2g34400-like n=1 Tax=Selaginella moellendorffii TaxID=88036 RepID=UPI000D1CFE1B|nr:pentatricopeptide repeat-containing protein At2g34400-like [Selaginella moellendorffii]|eukprot:XP_024531453.1 pentatricopeptide repeat-containing protein At2g34400-like [Selaginella moellendorffii]